MLEPPIRSSLLLRRMEVKGHLTRDVSMRLPSAKRWGGKRGSYFVNAERDRFTMDGKDYIIFNFGNRKIVYGDRR